MTRFSRGVQQLGLMCTVAALMLLPTGAFGLGLGPMKVVSALNEPLDATIEFTSINNKELQTLEVGLAPVSAFQAVGIPFSSDLLNLQFMVEHHANGRPYLRVTTSDPFPEPYLHVLVQAEWAGGRLRREYTALINPPFYNPTNSSVAQTTQPNQAAASPATPAPQIQSAENSTPPVTTSGSGSESEPQIKVEPVPQTEAEGGAFASTPSGPAPAPVIKSESLPSTEIQTAPPPVTATETAPLAVGQASKSNEAANQEANGKLEPTGMLPGHYFGPQVAAAPVNAQGWASSKRYHVKRGDTAWEIAQRIRRNRSLSLEQVVLALYYANPRAFYGKNVNNLKAGKILRVPEVSTVRKLSSSQAHTVFFAQYDQWQEYKLKLARSQNPVQISAADNQPSAPKAANTAAAARPIGKRPHMQPNLRKSINKPMVHHESHASAVKGTKKAHVKIAPPKPTLKTLKPKLALKTPKPMGIQLPPVRSSRKEELLRIVRANLDQGKQPGKTAESETKAAQQQKLDQSVARLNSTAAGKKPKGDINATEAGTPLPTPRTDHRPLEIANPHLAKVEPAPPTKAKKQTPILKPKLPHKPLRVERRPFLPHPVPPPSENGQGLMAMAQGMLKTAQGMLKELMGSQNMLMLLAALVVLSGLVGAVYVRRRRKSLTEFEESILTSGDVATSDFSTDSGDNISAGSASDTSFLSDFSQGGLGNISTDEVDPVAEADVYLAYGRDEQAEEILKDAVVKNPNRHELKEKLLEIYAGRSDVAAFETLAEELYASLGGQGGPLWDRVVDMGRKLAPDNPMFSSGGAPAPQPPAAGADETIALSSAAAPIDFGRDDSRTMDGADTGGLEFDLGGDSEAADTSLEMDLSPTGAGGLAAPAPAPEPQSEPEQEEGLQGIPESSGLDFDFNLDSATDTPAETAPEAEEAPAVAEDDSSGLEFTGLEGFGDSLADADEGDNAEIALPELDAGADEEGLSSSESLDFEALRQNTAENNKPGLSLSIGTDMGGLEEDSGDVAVENEISFDNEDVSFEAPSVPEAPATTGGISAEVDDPSVTVGGGQDQWDEAATKLDLAKAYIDMGDADGARSILEEVAVEGNDDQKRQAAELASQIS